MANNQFERHMQFIVEQQAQFSADILELKETQKMEGQLWREKYDNLTDAITTIVGMVGKLAEAHERLTATQERTDEQLRARSWALEQEPVAAGIRSERVEIPSQATSFTPQDRGDRQAAALGK